MAMDDQNIQRCQQNGEYAVQVVASHSDPEVTHAVLVIDVEEPSESICDCEGFLFRGTCSHQQEAVDAMCMWNEIDGPEKQEGPQRRNRVCPRCGGPTEWITLYA